MVLLTVKSSLIPLLSTLLSIILFSPSTVSATALTYKIDANERGCFYAWVDKVGEKLAFYFAVPLLLSPVFSSPSLNPGIGAYVIGSSRRILRYWLRSQRSSPKDYPWRDKGKARRFCIYSPTIRGILLLFLKWHVYLCGKSRRFRNYCTTPPLLCQIRQWLIVGWTWAKGTITCETYSEYRVFW